MTVPTLFCVVFLHQFRRLYVSHSTILFILARFQFLWKLIRSIGLQLNNGFSYIRSFFACISYFFPFCIYTRVQTNALPWDVYIALSRNFKILNITYLILLQLSAFRPHSSFFLSFGSTNYADMKRNFVYIIFY